MKQLQGNQQQHQRQQQLMEDFNYVDPLFNGRSKFKGAVYAVMAVQELHHLVRSKARHAAVYTTGVRDKGKLMHSRARHAAVFTTGPSHKNQHSIQRSRARHAAVFTTDPADDKIIHYADMDKFNARRKVRAAILVIMAVNEVQHWLDSATTLLYDTSFNSKRAYLGIHQDIERPMHRAVGNKFNPRRKFRATVYAIIAAKELSSHTALVANVRNTLAWLGQHTTSPSFVQRLYQDVSPASLLPHDEEETNKDFNPRSKARSLVLVVMAARKFLDLVARNLPSRNPRRKFRAAVYAVMATNKLQARVTKSEPEQYHFEKHLRLHHPHQRPTHTVQFDEDDGATVPAVPHKKNFRARRKLLGDTVVTEHTGMLHRGALRRTKSSE